MRTAGTRQVHTVEESSTMNRETSIPSVNISAEALAHLGDGEIAYIKTIRSEDVPAMFPQAPEIAPGLKLFALHGADGPFSARLAPIVGPAEGGVLTELWSARATCHRAGPASGLRPV